MNTAARPSGSSGDAEVLRTRARALARRPAPEVGAGVATQVLAFRLAGQRYALPMPHVAGVLPLRSLTPLPGVPACIAGVINVRGAVTAVVELRELLGLHPAGMADLHQVVLLQVAGIHLGLLVDVVLGVETLEPGAVQPFPGSPGAGYRPAVTGSTPEGLLLLDAHRIATDPRLTVDDPSDSLSSPELP